MFRESLSNNFTSNLRDERYNFYSTFISYENIIPIVLTIWEIMPNCYINRKIKISLANINVVT